MKQFNGYGEAKKQAAYSGSARLVPGAYVIKILDVKYIDGQNGNSDRIDLRFDIVEGDQKDFFKKQYEENQNEDKKWKGKTSVYVPTDDGSERDGYTKKNFAGWTNSIEESNSGYTWDWDEKKWKGKVVGLVFGETGTVIEGKEITYTEARFPISADKVRDGSAPAAKFKAKNGFGENSGSGSSVPGFVNVPADIVEDIPF